jgi:hypothetical protein
MFRACILLVALMGSFAAHAAVRDVRLDVPTRLQWGRTPDVPGFCGEQSLQMHGIFWGNWISTEYVYRAAGSKELLIGEQDATTAKNLKFQYEVFPSEENAEDHDAFAQWVKMHIDKGRIVVFGGYELKPVGLDNYDHIMPIMGYRVDTADPATVTGFWVASLFDKPHQLITRFANRAECTAGETDPSTWCSPTERAFAIALLGVEDTKKETVRTMLVMPSWYEPDWSQVDKLNEKPIDFTVKAVVWGLTVGNRYSILRFSTLASLPTSNFLGGKFTKRVDFTATAAKMEFAAFDKFSSNSTMFYRTVLNTSPTTRGPPTRAPSTRVPSTTRRAATTKAPTTRPTTRAPVTTRKPTAKAPTRPTTRAPVTTRKPTTKVPTTRRI